MSATITESAGPRHVRWQCREHMLQCGARPLVMGILNVTPDSFSDGNRYFDPDSAVARGLEMAAEGADIIDVGGESTRPGAEPVCQDEELCRVIPVVRRLCAGIRSGAGTLVSVDTSKAAVARQAVDAGACIINDVTALTGDPGMAGVARESGAGVILMHMKGNPRVMQLNLQYGDVVLEVARFLGDRIGSLVASGMNREQLAVDPGIGFGKTLDQNLSLLKRLDALLQLGRPVAVGLSRKSFLGKLTGRETDQRLIPGIAALSFCLANGAHVVRVHDVKESVDAAKVILALAGGGGTGD